uniref:Uncharacterized protein n=1 Tax=Leersia perrieri TaxID=77586 RepID=A0A0D9XGB0_9ORYZ
MELSNAFSISTEAFLLSKHMAYSIIAASQGNMILPSLVKPNSSCDILRSSLKTAVSRIEYNFREDLALLPEATSKKFAG